MCAVAHLQDREDRMHMLVHGPDRDAESGRDVPVGPSEAQVVEHLALARAQAIDSPG